MSHITCPKCETSKDTRKLKQYRFGADPQAISTLEKSEGNGVDWDWVGYCGKCGTLYMWDTGDIIVEVVVE